MVDVAIFGTATMSYLTGNQQAVVAFSWRKLSVVLSPGGAGECPEELSEEGMSGVKFRISMHILKFFLIDTQADIYRQLSTGSTSSSPS